MGIILSYVAREAKSDHSPARCAAVNKDWQYLFAQLTLRSFNLGPGDLLEFETTVPTHSDGRKRLRSVKFHDCADDDAHLDGGPAKSQPEHGPLQPGGSLLHLLEKRDRDANLHLELTIRPFTAGSLGGRRRKKVYRDAESLHSVSVPPQPDKDGLNHSIGEVPVVRSLSVLYREGEQIGTGEVMSLCSRLPKLKEVLFQNVRCRADYTQYFKIAESAPELPTTLKRLHVLGQGRSDPRGVCQFLVHRLASFGMSRRLREMSITTSDDAAEVFFEYITSLAPGPPVSGACYWPSLQSLTLTCAFVGPRVTNVAANRWLHRTGLAALGLPGLRELRLVSYHPRRHEEIDGLFYYSIVKGKGSDTAVCFGKSAQYSPQLRVMPLTDINSV